MNIQTMTPMQIRLAGWEALLRDLGPAGMARFLQQYEMGRGDYTCERHEWLDQEVETIVRRMAEGQQSDSSSEPNT